jgi:hypothetical protein
MSLVRVVLANPSAELPKSLLSVPRRELPNFATVHAAAEIRNMVPRLRAQLAVVDLEMITFQELADLCHEFPATAFVCIHRLADDAMWAQSLAAGAVDCCSTADLPWIMQNAERYVTLKQAEATSAA